MDSSQKFSRSSSSTTNIDHNENQQGVTGHSDHDVIASPIPVEGESLDLSDNSANFIPNTALVLGLAAAACFILLVVYIILKVHFCNKKKPTPKQRTILIPPKASSGVENMAFHGDSAPRLVNPIQQTGSTIYHVHPIEFNQCASESTLAEPGANAARLTGARLLTGQ